VHSVKFEDHKGFSPPLSPMASPMGAVRCAGSVHIIQHRLKLATACVHLRRAAASRAAKSANSATSVPTRYCCVPAFPLCWSLLVIFWLRVCSLKTQSGAATDSTEAALEKEHEERTKVKNIDMVQIGAYQLDTWYYSPYPDEVSKHAARLLPALLTRLSWLACFLQYRSLNKLYICEFCLKYMKKLKTLEAHKARLWLLRWLLESELTQTCGVCAEILRNAASSRQ
jgi:hypothetical protein